DGTLVVRRALDADPDTGARRWTRPFTWTGYQTADLAYAVTGHSAQGRTVTAGIAVVTGTEDRHWLYVALNRGRDRKPALAFPQPPPPPPPQPRPPPPPQPAPPPPPPSRTRRPARPRPASQPGQ